MELKKFLDLMADVVAKSLAPFVKRIEAIESRQPEKGDKGDAGDSATAEQLDALVEKAVSPLRKSIDDALAAIPAPKDGKDGTSIVIEDVEPLLTTMFAKFAEATDDRLQRVVREAAANIPKPKDGKDGASVIVEQVEQMVKTLVDAWSARADETLATLAKEIASSIPMPKDGKDGLSVTLEQVVEQLMPKHLDLVRDELRDIRVKAIEIVQAIPVPRDGKDGLDGKPLTLADVADWLDGNFAKWALPAERRVFELGEKAVAAMPKPRDGVDGLSADDIEIVGRSLRFKRAGKVIKEATLDFPMWRGVYDDAETYDAHDMVTFGGSVWIATEGDGTKRPGNEGSAWRLAVKKGRDGRDAT